MLFPSCKTTLAQVATRTVCTIVLCAVGTEFTSGETKETSRPSTTATPEAWPPPRHHSWARFPVGAWQRVRIVSQVLDETETVVNTSVAHVTKTLTEITARGVRLKIERMVELEGKSFSAPPQIVYQGFADEVEGEQVFAMKDLKPATLTLDGREFLCHVREIDLRAADHQRTVKIFYSNTRAPYVLRQETISQGTAAEQVEMYESVLETIALDMPYPVLMKIKSTILMKKHHRHPRGSDTAWVVLDPEIPGGVVAQSAKKVNAQGQTVGRNLLQLTDHGLSSADRSHEVDDVSDATVRKWRRLRGRRRATSISATQSPP